MLIPLQKEFLVDAGVGKFPLKKISMHPPHPTHLDSSSALSAAIRLGGRGGARTAVPPAVARVLGQLQNKKGGS